MIKHFKRIGRLNNLDPAPISERGMKLMEEAGELAKEINRTTGRKKGTHPTKEVRHDLLSEAADTIQCVFSIIHQFNEENKFNAPEITYQELEDKVGVKNDKWVNSLD